MKNTMPLLAVLSAFMVVFVATIYSMDSYGASKISGKNSKQDWIDAKKFGRIGVIDTNRRSILSDSTANQSTKTDGFGGLGFAGKAIQPTARWLQPFWNYRPPGFDAMVAQDRIIRQFATSESRIFVQTRYGRIFSRNLGDTAWSEIPTESTAATWQWAMVQPFQALDSQTLMQYRMDTPIRLDLRRNNSGAIIPANSEILTNTPTFNTIAFLSPRLGLLGGSQLGVKLTEDSGKSWRPLLWKVSALLAVRARGLDGRGLGGTWLKSQVLLNDSLAFFVGDSGAVIRYDFRNRSLTCIPVPQAPTYLSAFAFSSAAHGVVVADSGFMAMTVDSGNTWKNLPYPDDLHFGGHALAFVNDQHGFLAGDSGGLYETQDGGLTWQRMTQKITGAEGNYLRFPPPAYFLVIALVFFLLWPAFRRQPPKIISRGIGENLSSDTPLQNASEDKIGLSVQAQALTGFLMNPATKPPLTFGVMGEWGKGKSSFLRIAQSGLNKKGYVTVWFNAWHHQSEESLLAALLENIRRSELLGVHTFDGFLFRVRLTWRRLLPQLPKVFIVVALAFLLYFIFESLSFDLTSCTSDLAKRIAKLFGVNSPEGTAQEGIKSWLELVGLLLKGSPLLLGFFAIWKAITRVLVLFETKPAQLLTGISEKTKILDLSNKIGFRETFRREFEDVTSALADKPMVIFIDDLDRCRPATVMETLEAINFLVTCGPCYFVIAMDRAQISRAIITQDKDYLELFRKENRSDKAYAQNYLEKLIQVELAVPQADGKAFNALLKGSVPVTVPKLEDKLWKVKRYAPLIFLFVLALACIGYLTFKHSDVFAVDLPASAVTTEIPASVPATVAVSTDTARLPTHSGDGNQSLSDQVSQEDANLYSRHFKKESADKSHPKPGYTEGKSTSSWASFLTFAVFYSVLAFMVIALFAWRERRGRLEFSDSEEFSQAIMNWGELVHLAARTPRGAKKYINRLRFFATLRREWQKQWTTLQALSTQPLGSPPLPGDADLVALSSLEFALRTLMTEPMDLCPENVLALALWLEHKDQDQAVLAQQVRKYVLSNPEWGLLLEGFALLGAQVQRTATA